MTPDRIEILLIMLILSILGHGVVILFRSPKEVLQGLEEKIDAIERDYAQLGKAVAAMEKAMSNLEKSVDRLTNRMDNTRTHAPRRG